ncbi:hypothetical protein [Echinicola sp. 20G]|uniref:hypothetical protein n=1 Tax=Echinicola sp. 20G TaxID=2781961 RepID=UPI00191077D5|nr:hypothetical protein [Echinicola sp. 20G]
MKVREIAWNGIDEGEFGKESVTIDWRKANVEVEDDNYKVIFSTTHVTLGPNIVYVDIETMEIEGLAPRY